MKNLDAQYCELLTLTKLYLAQEGNKRNLAKIPCTNKLYDFFKEEARNDKNSRKALRVAQAKPLQSPPLSTPPAPLVLENPILKPILKAAPDKVTKKPLVRKAPIETPRSEKKGFVLTKLDPAPSDFSDVHTYFSKSCPNTPILAPLSELENRQKKDPSTGPYVVLVEMRANAREKLFLQGIALALEKVGANVSISKTPNCSSEKKTKTKWILTSTLRNEKLPEGVVAPIYLREIDHYIQNPLEKKTLWIEIQEKILGA